MNTRIGRLWAVMLTVVIVSGAFAGSVSAGRLSVSEQRWTLNGTVESENGEGAFRIRCPVTLTGSFYARTFAKTRAAIGEIQSERVGEAACTGEGSMRVDTEGFPYRYEYESFTGTLPNISEIRTQIANLPRRWNLYRWWPIQWCGYQYWPGDPTWSRINRAGAVATHYAWLRYISGPWPGCPPVLVAIVGGGYVSSSRAPLTISLI
jgi:hypothetical protein